MIIKIAYLPVGVPFAVGSSGELIINAIGINDLEKVYDQALEDFYTGSGGHNSEYESHML